MHILRKDLQWWRRRVPNFQPNSTRWNTEWGNTILTSNCHKLVQNQCREGKQCALPFRFFLYPLQRQNYQRCLTVIGLVFFNTDRVEQEYATLNAVDFDTTCQCNPVATSTLVFVLLKFYSSYEFVYKHIIYDEVTFVLRRMCRYKARGIIVYGVKMSSSSHCKCCW